MKRLLESRLLSAALLADLGFAPFLLPRTPAAPAIPPLENIQGMEACAILEGHTREEVHSAWGGPDGMLSGLLGDIYDLSEFSHIVIYYDPEPMNEGTADAYTVPVLYAVYGEA